jgi:hypothetical protein
MISISVLSLRILVRSPTLIGLDLPLTTLVGITRNRRQSLTYKQETRRAKLERLRSTKLIHDDPKTTTRHAMALNKTNELISLLAPTLSTIKQVISHLRFINMIGFAF